MVIGLGNDSIFVITYYLKVRENFMRRRLEMVLATCEQCPWCRYDSYYSISKDSGYDCRNLDLKSNNNRIIDDGNFYPKRRWPTIPDWCPLPIVLV